MKVTTEEILNKRILTEGEIKLLVKRANAGEDVNAKRYAIKEEEYLLTNTHEAKGIAYLLDQWKTPKGVERKNNPFGAREEDVLATFKYFEFVELYNAGNMHFNVYTPIYNVIGENGSFQYYMWGGKVNIIG